MKKRCRYQDFMQPLTQSLYELIQQARQSGNISAFRGLPPVKSASPEKRKRRQSRSASTKE
ncbi:hypothetical protein DZJ_05450 [Dickeya ananatis]